MAGWTETSRRSATSTPLELGGTGWQFGVFSRDEVGYHEPGEEDHSGDHRGGDEVVALLEKLVAVSEGTFQLEPEAFLNLQQHSAVLVRWWAEREGRRSDGYEIAVFRLSDGKIAEVWFYNEPSDPEAFSAVFAFT